VPVAETADAHAVGDGADVLGGGTTTPADDLRAGLHEVPGVRGHVLGAGHVHGATAHFTGHAGVRLRAELATRDVNHALDALEDALGPD
jgi:hypothetical protein